MKKIFGLILALATLSANGDTRGADPHHPMQHGFILAVGDRFASHLVAEGHHSRQVEVEGELTIPSASENQAYRSMREESNADDFYFLFQAQNVTLPEVRAGDELVGHIIRMEAGKYQPKNPVIAQARFKIKKVLLNVENPFFGTPEPQTLNSCDFVCQCLRSCEGPQCDLCGMW